MIQKQGNWVPYELKLRDVDFAACQQSVQCCKVGENLLGYAEMGGLTSPAVLSRCFPFRLPFVLIDGIRPDSSAFPLFWRSQKMDRFMDPLKRCIVFSSWHPTIVRKKFFHDVYNTIWSEIGIPGIFIFFTADEKSLSYILFIYICCFTRRY